jgi:hypothetical protein
VESSSLLRNVENDDGPCIDVADSNLSYGLLMGMHLIGVHLKRVTHRRASHASIS